MTEQRNQLTDLFAACWKDETLKQRFMADPKAVLAEYGMDVPDGMDVNVVENTDNTVHITMPVPPDGHADLSDEELSAAAGGTTPVTPADVAVIAMVGAGTVATLAANKMRPVRK